ncbi:TPA: hypothetical protein DDZ86_02880 [Candidatus Dependentiae bacterium]|nr:MAG: hypothetical protein UW09_C0001G0070 [candidate division TM6 bacterium GW2011_GWF2_43_87]HBL98564.1 hypothetical protein [Candidatus Dependentiae bacterium]
MEIFSQLVAFIKHEWLLVTWRDAVEITVFSYLAHRILRWLGQDQQKNLVAAFYGYFAITVLAFYAQLSGLAIVLFACAPAVAMIFILTHQQTLQKNFITLKTVAPKRDAADQWLEEVIQASLRGVNKNKTVICIIERTGGLSPFLTARCVFNAPVTRELLTLLMNSSADAEETLTIWVNQMGLLVAVNPVWHAEYDEIWVSKEIKMLHKWKQDALFITQKSDALVTVLSPDTRLFDVLVDGKSFDNVSAGYAFSLIKQICFGKTDSKGSLHASISRKTSQQQPRT